MYPYSHYSLAFNWHVVPPLRCLFYITSSRGVKTIQILSQGKHAVNHLIKYTDKNQNMASNSLLKLKEKV